MADRLLIFLLIVIITSGLVLAGCNKETAPRIYDLVAPDSLHKGSPDTSYLFIKADDPQGHNDIDSVFFTVLRPDGTTNGIHFYMHDDGQLGDSVPLDGTYTLGILAPAANNQTGAYTFRFLAVDRSAHQSNRIDKTIVAYDWPNPVVDRLFVNQYDIERRHIFVSARVYDAQGQGDIASVELEVTYVDSAVSIGWFEMTDDGQGADTLADDRRFSADIISPGEHFSAGTYHMRISALDLSGHEGTAETTIVIGALHTHMGDER